MLFPRFFHDTQVTLVVNHKLCQWQYNDCIISARVIVQIKQAVSEGLNTSYQHNRLDFTPFCNDSNGLCFEVNPYLR